MFKILVWDYTGLSTKWLEQFIDAKDVVIVDTMTSEEPVSEILLKKDAWDWILIFEQGARKFFDATIQLLKLPSDKVIYALDINSWLQHPKAAFALIDPVKGLEIYLHINFILSQQLNDFITCTVEGISYVTTTKDTIIMRDMYVNRVNYSAAEMRMFHTLSKEYYNVDDSAGYFLDLGANIGTTGISFIKKLTPNLKLLAFEPDPENFKMLRMNLILNDIDADKAIPVNYGLGDKFDEMTMYINTINPGGNSIFQYYDDMPSEVIKIMPLDSYIAENNIAPEEVKYIWIDTEGFEAQVLLGAKNLLKRNSAPIFTELNLGKWREYGNFNSMIMLLEKYYSHFIHFYGGKQILYPLETLRTMESPNNSLGQIGDILFIKSGTINQ